MRRILVEKRMPHRIVGSGNNLVRHVPVALGMIAQIVVMSAMLVSLSACGGGWPMTVESRYVDPAATQPTIDQKLAFEQQKARRGHN
jgi:hypothetical protein